MPLAPTSKPAPYRVGARHLTTETALPGAGAQRPNPVRVQATEAPQSGSDQPGPVLTAEPEPGNVLVGPWNVWCNPKTPTGIESEGKKEGEKHTGLYRYGAGFLEWFQHTLCSGC